MTVALNDALTTFLGDGVTTAFDFDFPAETDTQIAVLVDGVLIDANDYSVEFNPSQVVLNVAPATGAKGAIIRLSQITQEILYSRTDNSMNVAALAAQLDNIVLKLQEVDRDASFAVKTDYNIEAPRISGEYTDGTVLKYENGVLVPGPNAGQLQTDVDAAAASAAASAASAVDSATSATASDASADNSAASAVAAAASAASIDPTSILATAKLYNDTRYVINRPALKALAGGVYTAVYLFEVGRTGWFKWTSGDLSAQVAADTREGIYVKATDTAASVGAWVRQGAWNVIGADINWFYETADGSDYSAAIAAAAAVTGLLTAKAGSYQIVSGVTWPAKNITLRGYMGDQVRFYGSGTLFTWPASVTDGGGNVVTQNVFGVMIETTANNIGLKIHQTWDASGKIGPIVSGCRFLNSSATTTTARSISLQGVWVGEISNNWFFGKGPTGGVGGHGVYVELGDDLNTAVMNVSVRGNQFTKMGSAFWIEDRTLAIGGRVEGCSFTDNKISASYNGVRASQTLSTLISGNMFDCTNIAISLTTDFDFTITGNVRLAGAVAGVQLSASAAGILERGVITGNQIQAVAGAAGILFANSNGNSAIRNITINGNAIGHTSTDTGTGIKFTGTSGITNVNINGNVFEGLSIGIDYAGATNTSIQTTNNNWTAVTTKINNPEKSGQLYDVIYAASILKTLAGGATSETFDLDISTGNFAAKPTSAIIELDGSFLTATTRLLKVGYDYANAANTAISARFIVCNVDGTNVGSGARRFNALVRGQGYAIA